MISASSTPGTAVAISYPKSGSSVHSMVSWTMAWTMADENGMATFFEPGWPSPPPTRPVLSTNTVSSWLSSSSSIRFPMSAMSRGKNGLVPGTRRNLPSSSLPPAEVPVVSPSMKYAAACARSRRATPGTMFSFRFRMSRNSAGGTWSAGHGSTYEKGHVVRPFLVYEVSRKSTAPSASTDTFSR